MEIPQSIAPPTRICAVIGNPVAHSLSPAIHNAAFEALGLDYVYLAFKVENVKEAMEKVRATENFRGLSVTIPHKIEALKYMDEIAEVDRAIGSINTVIHEQNKLIGRGTDGPSALKALADAGVDLENKTVLMLGAGGAARAIAFPLTGTLKLRQLSMLDINETLLQQLRGDLQRGTSTPITAEPLTGPSLAKAMVAADVVIHCTSVGMHPREDASLVPPELFRPEQVVFDIVYTPLETRLLAEARRRGCTVIRGSEMFINQAALQFKYFTGLDAPVEIMRRVVMEQLQS
jgi:shikimate dehydrogenase